MHVGNITVHSIRKAEGWGGEFTPLLPFPEVRGSDLPIVGLIK